MGYFVGTPKVYNKELFLKRVEDIVDSQVFTDGGKYVQLLEKEAASYLGVKYCFAVCNASIGLEIALRTVAPTSGEVLVPAFAPIGTIHSIINAGYVPKFVDIDQNYCINIKDLIKKFHQCQNPKAVLACNLFGNSCNVGELSRLPLFPSIPVIYDSSHALGVFNEDENQNIGNFGEVEVFSLNSKELINAGEGGLITTNNDKIADVLNIRRDFGLSPYTTAQEEYWNFGTNGKLSETSAALGLTNFEHIESIQSHYFDNYITYKNNLPSGCLMKEKNVYFSNFSYITVEVENRDKILNKLYESDIYPRTYFTPCHLTKIYKSLDTYLPITESIAKKVMCLPTGLTINKEQIELICSKLDWSIKYA